MHEFGVFVVPVDILSLDCLRERNVTNSVLVVYMIKGYAKRVNSLPTSFKGS
jgi:hypothetical protein